MFRQNVVTLREKLRKLTEEIVSPCSIRKGCVRCTGCQTLGQRQDIAFFHRDSDQEYLCATVIDILIWNIDGGTWWTLDNVSQLLCDGDFGACSAHIPEVSITNGDESTPERCRQIHESSSLQPPPLWWWWWTLNQFGWNNRKFQSRWSRTDVLSEGPRICSFSAAAPAASDVAGRCDAAKVSGTVTSQVR